MATNTKVPYHQIRASYTPTTITVYQAYKKSIADAAVANQKLNASPDFKPGRMTWVKPSWAWMMYRAGYSYKDKGQERILALKMKHEHFIEILEKGVLTTHEVSSLSPSFSNPKKNPNEKPSDVKIQWDPERDAKLNKLTYRSIQIGIPGAWSTTWANEWIAEIEDVTDMARELKRVIDEQPDISIEELAKMGLIPEERSFEVSPELMKKLRMDTPV